MDAAVESGRVLVALGEYHGLFTEGTICQHTMGSPMSLDDRIGRLPQHKSMLRNEPGPYKFACWPV